MTHICPATGCAREIPTHIFMCARHWRLVPTPIKDAIRDAWEKGDTKRHRANSTEAIKVVAEIDDAMGSANLPAGTKALTVYQPWASMIIYGWKPWEFRKWKFTDKTYLAKLVGQRIIMHASARPVRVAEVDDILARIEEGESALSVDAVPFLKGLRQARQSKEVGGAPISAALGTVILGEPKSVVEIFKDKVADSDRLDHHMYGWPMTEPIVFPKPIPAAGAQGFWNWS